MRSVTDLPQKEHSPEICRRRPPQANGHTRCGGCSEKVIVSETIFEPDVRADRHFFEDSRLTVEATASYEWFVQWVEPLAMRIVLSPNQHRRCSGLIDRRVFQTGMVTRRGYATSGF